MSTKQELLAKASADRAKARADQAQAEADRATTNIALVKARADLDKAGSARNKASIALSKAYADWNRACAMPDVGRLANSKGGREMGKGNCEVCGKVLSKGHIFQKGPYCDPCIEQAVAEYRKAQGR